MLYYRCTQFCVFNQKKKKRHQKKSITDRYLSFFKFCKVLFSLKQKRKKNQGKHKGFFPSSGVSNIFPPPCSSTSISCFFKNYCYFIYMYFCFVPYILQYYFNFVVRLKKKKRQKQLRFISEFLFDLGDSLLFVGFLWIFFPSETIRDSFMNRQV